MNKFLIGAGLLAAYSIFRATEGAKTLDYEVQNVRIHKWSITNPAELELRALVKYINPSSVKFTVDSVALNVYYKGVRVADCFTNDPTVIEPKGYSVEEYPLRIKLAPSLLAIVPLLKDKKPLPSVDVQGFIKVGGIDQKITAKVNLAQYDPRDLLPKAPNPTKTAPAPKGATAKAQQAQQAPVLPVPRTPIKDLPAPAPNRPATSDKKRPAAKAQLAVKKAGDLASKAQGVAKKVKAAGGAKAAAKQAITKPVNDALNPFKTAAAAKKPLPMQTGVTVKKKAAKPAKTKKTAKRAGKSK